MQFQSVEFLFFFLPVFMAAYYIFPSSWRSSILLAGSLLFYSLSCDGQYWQLTAALALTVFTYFAARYLGQRRWPWILAVSLGALAVVLIFFKVWRGGSRLPSGMSFYLFYLAAYLIEIYQQKLRSPETFVDFGAKALMFPRLLSGPIADPCDMRLQDPSGNHPKKHFHQGLQKLILGLSMKVLVADRLAGLWSQAAVTGYESISVPFAWLALTAYALRLYLDFRGYSLMAVGLGELLGFQLPKNFDNPYASKTVSEFYRRWHMTLGKWFRDYIYIPLGGSRKGNFRTVVNLLLVWLLTGLWHGIGANFLLWAGFLLLFIVNEKLWLGKIIGKTKVLGHIYTVFVILLSWLPFAIGSWQELVMYAGRLFGVLGQTLNGRDFLTWGKMYCPFLAAGLLLATPWPEMLWKKIRGSGWTDAALFVLFWAVVYCICTAEQSPFLYFQY